MGWRCFTRLNYTAVLSPQQQTSNLSLRQWFLLDDQKPDPLFPAHLVCGNIQQRRKNGEKTLVVEW